jgi:hypothetical protein
MYLKLADRLVKQGDFAGALQAIAKAREVEPGNRYAIAYEERVRHLLEQSENPGSSPLSGPNAPGSSNQSAGMLEDFPTAEKQIRRIATVLPKTPAKPSARPPQPDSKNIAILTKVASLLTTANEHLVQQRFNLALETVARAALLDPKNKDIRTIEARIRATQEEEQRRAGRLREERALEEKRERDRALQQELDRLKFERDCKRQDEENQRRSAQEKKIEQSLRRANDFLKAGQLDEAQCEFSFVSVLAPGRPEVLSLETELSRSREERDRLEQEAYRRHREEVRLREQQLRDEIGRCIHEAEDFAARELFGDALRVLTDAYLRDPNNRDVEACENRILAARKSLEEDREVLRLRQEEQARKRVEEAESLRHQERWATLRHAVLQQEEDQKKKTEMEIANHLQAARLYLDGDQFKDALAEIALAFVLNPLHPDVRAMEQEINARKAPQAPARPPTPVILSPEVEADLEAIAKHIAGAKHLMSERRFAAALHEVNQALTRDPENIAARRLASRIEKEQQKEGEEHRDGRQRGSGSSSARHLRPDHGNPPTLHPAALSLGDFLGPTASPHLPLPVSPGENASPGGARKQWLKKFFDRLAGPDASPGISFPRAGPPEGPGLVNRPDSDLDSLRGGVSY